MRRRTILICLVAALLPGGWLVFQSWSKNPPTRVKYGRFPGEVSVATMRIDPLQNREQQVPAVECGGLIEFVGKTPSPKADEAPILWIECVQYPRTPKAVIFNSTSEGLQQESVNGSDYRVLMKAPVEPGNYLFVVKWGFTKEIQSFRAEVVKKQTTRAPSTKS